MQLVASILPGPPDQVARKILEALAKHLNSSLPRCLPGIRRRLGQAVELAVVASPEFASLVGGRLQAELGVPEPLAAVRAIIDGITSGMEIRVNRVTPQGVVGLSGGLSIGVLRDDLTEVLGLPHASFESEGGHQVDWLEWLLTSGGAIVNADYGFVAGPFAGSRTGLGVMKRGGGWRVPVEHAGTYRDNWLSRALGTLEHQVEGLVESELREKL